MNNKITVVLLFSIALNIILSFTVLKQRNTLLRAQRVTTSTPTPTPINSQQTDNIFGETNPEEGYEVNAVFGAIGPKMIEMGVIDGD